MRQFSGCSMASHFFHFPWDGAWHLFFGFLFLTIGFMKLYNRDPSLLPKNEYNYDLLRRINQIGILICILVLMFILSPPINREDESVPFFLQLLLNCIWIAYYGLISGWLLITSLFTNKMSISEIKNRWRLILHLILGLLLSSEYILQTMGLIFFPNSLLTSGLLVIVITITLVFFLIFQIYYFYKLSRFSFKIIG